jgi:hypothetical protein
VHSAPAKTGSLHLKVVPVALQRWKRKRKRDRYSLRREKRENVEGETNFEREEISLAYFEKGRNVQIKIGST